jgi:N-acetylmuramoyl-L-alanine amidase
MTQLIYLLKTVFISGLLFAYFWIFLRNRFFHSFNRLFLICIPLFSFLLPALHFNLPEFWNRSAGASPIHLLGVAQGGLEEAVTIYAKRNPGHSLSWEWIALIITLIFSTMFFIRFLKTIRYLRNLRRNRISVQLPEATVYFVSEKGTPFSFFKSIFWGEEMDMNSPEGRQILHHELFHVRNNHSLDIIGMEIISIICWFNPFFYLIGRELKLIHEYAADACVVAETNEYEYAGLLLTKISGRPFPLTNPFFKNQIKRRITMITKSNKNKKALLGRFMILPVLALLICLFSFKIKTILPFHATKNIKVVIDAGHGGAFPGTQMNGVFEKDINLSISKKIQSLAGEYNVDVIMSRETDITPGSNKLSESLEYIAALPKNKNADLFISIHTNQTANKKNGEMQTTNSGFQIYIPRNTSNVYEGSVKLGSVLTETIKSDYNIEPELKQIQDNGNSVLILKKATVPAVLIECGYMDNPADMKYLQDEKNQEKIARDILEAIKKYSLANAIPATEISPTNTGKQNKLVTQTSNTEINNEVVIENQVNKTNVTKNISEEIAVTKVLAINENSLNSSAPLKKVQVDANYPGDAEGWKAYLFKNLKYPQAAVSNEVQGEVIVEFVVNTDGSISKVHAISGPKELRSESVRVVKESGYWVPAMNKGAKVASYKKQPIVYKLEAK